MNDREAWLLSLVLADTIFIIVLAILLVLHLFSGQ